MTLAGLEFALGLAAGVVLSTIVFLVAAWCALADDKDWGPERGPRP